jgi:hypothetical protein
MIEQEDIIKICKEQGLTYRIYYGENYTKFYVYYKPELEMWSESIIDSSLLMDVNFPENDFMFNEKTEFLLLYYKKIKYDDEKKYWLDMSSKYKTITINQLTNLVKDSVAKLKQTEVEYKLKQMEKYFK